MKDENSQGHALIRGERKRAHSKDDMHIGVIQLW